MTAEDGLRARGSAIQLVAMDLDGTALRSDGTFSGYTKDRIEEVISRGVHLAAASGRSFASLPAELRQIRGLEYVIVSNGAAIHSLTDGRRIYEDLIRADRVPDILEAVGAFASVCGPEDLPEVLECVVGGVGYASAEFLQDPLRFGMTERGSRYVRSTRRPVADMPGFLRMHAAELDAVDIIVQPGEHRRQWERRLAAIPDIYVTSSVSTLLEIASGTAGKASAVSWLAVRLGLEPRHIMAFGNAENDRDMLELAGLGVAVANSPAPLLEAADYVTDDNDHDGVAHALETFILSR